MRIRITYGHIAKMSSGAATARLGEALPIPWPHGTSLLCRLNWGQRVPAKQSQPSEGVSGPAGTATVTARLGARDLAQLPAPGARRLRGGTGSALPAPT